MWVLRPIWNTKTETASRVRGRIEAVLDWAKVLGYRGGENPARWRGHIDKLLPKKTKVAKKKPHPALPFEEMNAFVVALRQHGGTAAAALEFAILTAVRTDEAIGTRWDEIDLKAKVWTIPAERMKAEKEHRVPLSDAALAVLERMAAVRQNDYVFPGQRAGKPLWENALRYVLEAVGRTDITVHGFRSTFRTWAAEVTNFPWRLCEAALAHKVGDETERSYQRGDMFEKRRVLMKAWERYIDTPVIALPADNVVPLRSATEGAA
jgi:integrase